MCAGIEQSDGDALLTGPAAFPFDGPVIDVDDARLLPPGDMPVKIADACRSTDQPVPGNRLFLNRIADGETPSAGRTTLGLRDYVDAMRGGFREPALRLDRRASERWFDGYVDQLVKRDATEIEHRRSTVRLRAYLEAYALNSAGVVDETTLIAAAHTNRRSADAYRDVLLSLGVIDEFPASPCTPARARLRSTTG